MKIQTASLFHLPGSKPFLVTLLLFGVLVMHTGLLNAQCVQRSSTTTVTGLFSSVTNKDNAIDKTEGDITTAAALNVSVIASVSLRVNFDRSANQGDSVIVMFGIPESSLTNLELLGNVILTPYSNTNGSGTASTPKGTSNNMPVYAKDGTIAIIRFSIPVSATQGARSVDITFSNLGAISRSVYVYDAAVKPGTIPVATAAAPVVCRNRLDTLNASYNNVLTGQPVDILWYGPDGTTLLQTNSSLTGTGRVSYNTGRITNTRTYYVRKRWTGCTKLSDPVPITITVNPSCDVLPVTFGPIDARIKDNQLRVNWITESEKNNDHFLVAVSADGKNFKTAATVKTLAPDGSATTRLDYSVTIDYSKITELLFGSMSFLLLLGCLGFKRTARNRLLLLTAGALLIAGAGTFYACTRKQDAVKAAGNTPLFVRITQVNKDGTSESSKVVTAVYY